MDESGTVSRGVVTPDSSNRKRGRFRLRECINVGPQTFCAAFFVCVSGCLLVAVALGLGPGRSWVFVARGLWSALPVQFLFCGVQARGEARYWPVLRPKRKGTDLKTGSDPKITLKLKSGSFGGHPRG